MTLPVAVYRWTGQVSSSADAFRAGAVETLLNALLLMDSRQAWQSYVSPPCSNGT